METKLQKRMGKDIKHESHGAQDWNTKGLIRERPCEKRE